MNSKQLLITVFILTGFVQMSLFAQVKTLDYFISQGLAHSPVLKDLSNQISLNEVDSLITKAGKKPQVSYNGLLFYAPIINGLGYAEPLTNLSTIGSTVYATQRIFSQKTIAAENSKFGIRNEALRMSSKITENDIKKAITLQYLTACSVSNDLVSNNELLESSKEEELILKQLVERGLYRQVDYYSFMVELKSREINVNDLQIQYRKELSALHILCGVPDTSYEQLELPGIVLKSPVEKANSPFFIRFTVDSLKIQNEKLLIDRNYKPSVNWFSDAGLLNNLPRDIIKNFGLSVGLSMTIPIYDGHQRKLNYEKLQIAENTRTGYAEYFARQFSSQLQQLYEELRRTRETIPAINQQLDFAQTVIKQDKDLLNTGNISVTDYVTALKNYIAVRQNLNQYHLRTLQIITEINYWNQ